MCTSIAVNDDNNSLTVSNNTYVMHDKCIFEFFNKFFPSDKFKKHKSILRVKFICLFTSNLFFLIPRLIYRIVEIFKGNFYCRGLAGARKKYLELRNAGRDYHQISKSIKIKHIAIELFKDIEKTILYPICAIASQLIALIGLFCPCESQHLYSKLEYNFYIKPKYKFKPSNGYILFLKLSAPCMQSKEKKEFINFNRYSINEKPERVIKYNDKIRLNIDKFIARIKFLPIIYCTTEETDILLKIKDLYFRAIDFYILSNNRESCINKCTSDLKYLQNIYKDKIHCVYLKLQNPNISIPIGDNDNDNVESEE